MIVGEAPGAAEDRAGRPFVGPAGRVVEGLLATIGLARSDVYITNTVMCRPAHNRTPTPDEVGACAPYLDLQLRLVQPRVILALGATAARRLVGGSGRLADLRGRALPIDGATVVATYHPSGLNRDPERRRLIASDFQLARRLIDEGRAESLP
jgi:DNA polymerase